MPKHANGHKMHPNSLEALARARAAAALKRKEMGVLSPAERKEQQRLKDEAEVLERAEELRKRHAKLAGDNAREQPAAKEPEPEGAATEGIAAQADESCAEAIDWKNYYKAKYKTKLSMQREPEYASIARDKLRRKVHAEARRTAWADVFPGVANPFG